MSDKKPILDQKGSQNFFNHIKQLWIEPEFERRKEKGTLPKTLQVTQCLIMFPEKNPPLVQFNDEFSWKATIIKDHETAFEKGDPIQLYQVNKVLNVEPPEIEGKRVGFVFLNLVGINWEIFFDFTPNHSISKTTEEQEWNLGKTIAESLQRVLIEKTVRVSNPAQEVLNEIGLWAVPSLLPYPLSKIMNLLKENDKKRAISLLESFCDSKFIKKISDNWWSIKQFEDRKKVISDAIEAHIDSKFTLSIPTLLPQIEGIVTDWIITKMPEEEVPWKQESKTKKFKDLVLDDSLTSKTFETIVNSTIKFILEGPILSTFKNWVESINSAFPNRNVISHGKHDDSIYTHQNSLKLILLLDTLHHIVLTRN